MKTLLSLVCSFVFVLFVDLPTAQAADYTDFVPKYRSQNKNFILSRIDYTSDKMIIHFKYVASREEEMVKLPGSASSSAWKLYASSRGTTGVTNYATIKNVKISGVLKAKKVEANNDAQFMAKFGEVLTGEAHFNKLPNTIRSIHFSAGDITTCNDLLIKEKSSPMLGTEEQMNTSVERFYRMLSNFGIDVVRATPAKQKTQLSGIDFKDQSAPKPAITKEEKVLQTAAQPVKYTPEELSSVRDMDCNKRVILKNVYFSDNSAEYAGRVEALKTIGIVVDYLGYYPKASIILHGHTDIFGNAVRNLELSKERVLAVKRSLVKAGIDSKRVSILFHGNTQPLPQFIRGGSKNRRVEVELICDK